MSFWIITINGKCHTCGKGFVVCLRNFISEGTLSYMLYIKLYVILSYTCYVVTKEMLYMWQRICPVLDKCYIRGHKWHLFGCRSICRVEGDNFDNFHPFVFDNHHHLCLRQSSSFNTVQRKGLLFMLDGTDSTVHLKMLKRIEEYE